MKNKLLNSFFALGWVLLFLFLGASFAYRQFAPEATSNSFLSISLQDHLSVFEGALSCSLTSAELIERKEELSKEIFPKVQRKEELAEGFIYYFEDEEGLLAQIMEFINKEKQCCPFFKFDLSILAFKKGLALKISGGPAVKDFLVEMLAGVE